MLKTNFGEERIRKWYQAFSKECSDGVLTREHLARLFKKVFPAGDSDTFCEHIFRVFDDDGNNALDFKVINILIKLYPIYICIYTPNYYLNLNNGNL